ncbi:MAG: histidine--tRNA ligase [Clostridiales bacterium]|nr:histidine--tRNA ligase [Clostridiales bacterium]
MINIPKGTKDVLPEQSYKWHYVESVIREVASLFFLKEIRTPTFEHTELFLRGVGDTTDIVNKEMYTFNDKKGRSITLKPEGTAGVVRSVIENGLTNNVMPLKMYYETPVFRYERPQAGRLREHHQFGVEIYGAKGADMDAEVILIAYTLLKKVGLNVALNINSIGCPTCRKAYNEALKEYLKDSFNEICPVCQERYEKNPLRILDCKEEKCKAVCAKAPKIIDYLCDDCKEHFESLKSYLSIAGLEYTVNPNIVRGLDYYTRTVFEFVTTDLGSQGTVCGGGRYDNLVKQLGGPDVPCVGFGMGIERILMLMEAKGIEIEDRTLPDLYIASIGENAHKKAFELCYGLRLAGVKCEIDHMQRGVKPQFKYADKIRALNVITIGDSEIESSSATLKNMVSGEQTPCKLAVEDIAKLLI